MSSLVGVGLQGQPAGASTSELSAWSPGRAGTLRIAYLDPDLAVQEAQQRRVIILNADAYLRIPLIKAANPDALVLVYKNLAFTNSNSWSYNPLTRTDATFLTTGVGYGYADQNRPEWFLKGSDGKRLQSQYWAGSWHMDIGNPDYQAAWLANVKTDVETYGWDGVFMDDVNWVATAHNDPGPVRYPTDADMRAATRSMLQAVSSPLRAAGHQTYLNIGSGHAAPGLWGDWLEFADGAMEEHFTNWGTTMGSGFVWDWPGTGGWREQVEQLATAARMGKTALLRVGGVNGDRDALRYGLATYLLANDGRSVIAPPEMLEVTPPYYPEFDWDLGQPTGAFRHLGNSLYRRDFAGGTVLVNAAQTTAAPVDLGGTYLDHDGRAITKITLSGTRGAILRTAGPVPSTTTTISPTTTTAPPAPTTTAPLAPTTTTTAPPALTANYGESVLADGPVAYWRLGERSGSRYAADASGNGRRGNYKNGVRLGVTGAVAGDTAAGFDGVDDKVTVNDHARLRLNGSFSVEFWAQLTRSGNTWPAILSKGASSSANGYLIWYSADGALHFKRGNQEWTTPAGMLRTDRASHFALTYDGSTLRWYADGTLVSSGTARLATNSGTAALVLGQSDSTNNGGNTVLDEVAVYDRALSAAQVKGHHGAAGR
jgi:hypothetical protein